MNPATPGYVDFGGLTYLIYRGKGQYCPDQMPGKKIPKPLVDIGLECVANFGSELVAYFGQEQAEVLKGICTLEVMSVNWRAI